MNKRKAYKIVFDDLKQCDLFMGNYDPKNGSAKLMYGVALVMGNIAYNCGEEIYDEFDKTFFENLIKSIDKTKSK